MLYVTNINNNNVIAIDTATKAKTSTVVLNSALIPPSAKQCTQQDFRIFGLGVNSTNEVFIGAVCNAQSTQNVGDLAFYVFKTNRELSTIPTLVSNGALDFERTSSPGSTWQPWKASTENDGFFVTNPYPSVSDITFDGKDLILGMRDIFPDTTPKNGAEDLDASISLGDLIRLCPDTNGVLKLESNRSCGGKTATGSVPAPLTDGGGTGGISTGGPGGGEWFAGDDPLDAQAEGALGAIAKPAGFKNFASTQLNPKIYTLADGSNSSIYSSGVRWFNSDTGLSSKNNIVYNYDDRDWSFAKAGGLGDLEVLCEQAPVEIGNRVWLDDNANGVQDPGEFGIGGVKIDLLDANGVVVASTRSDPSATVTSGNYKFVLPSKDVAYKVRVDVTSAQGMKPTTSDLGANDSFDSDGVVNGNFITVDVPALGAGQNTHTFDFGFVEVYALGNKVFEDKNNNGIFDTGDTPIAGQTVKLLNASGVLIAGKTTTTDANGHYYFADLAKGEYIVEVTTPAGLVSSSGTNGSLTGTYEVAPDPDGTPKLDNDDNGTKFDATLTRSLPISLGTNVPAGEDQGSVVNLPDSRNDYTVDFGFYKPASLGDKVWLDTDKDGIQDSGENGVGSVTVTLYQNACGASGTVIGTTTTDANGNYSFGNLVAGNYYVKFTLPNGMEFTVKGAGSNTALDSNADTTSGCSDAVTLAYGANDPTIDAGIKTPVVPIDLAIKKSITNLPASGYFKPGDVVDYKLEITNNGPGTASKGYKAEDILPMGMTYVANSAGATGYSCSSVAQVVTCVSDHSLAPSVKETITLKAQIASVFNTPTATLKNVAVVKPDPKDPPETIPEGNCEKNADGTYKDPTDVSKCNNVDPEEFPLPMDLVIVKSITNRPASPGTFKPGDIVEYQLEVTNRGPATAKAGFTVSDTLPSELSYEGVVSGDGYNCIITGKTVVCTSDHALPLGVKDSITYKAKIAATLSDSVKQVRNVAVVKPNLTDPTPEIVPEGNCEKNADGSYKDPADVKVCNNVDPEEFPLPKGASLGDFVFYDTDHDGIQDPGENGIEGITVELHENSCDGAKLAETDTGANGSYLFSNLIPGKSYVVKFITKDGLVITTQNVGDDTKDSDANSAGCTTPVVLGDGEYNPTIDAGMYKPWASIGDYVWLDTNKNGIQDGSEVGIAKVSVSLLNTNGTVIKTMETGADGKYLFTNLEPRDYSISFVIPSGHTLSPKDNGDNAKDSDAGSDGKTVKTTLDPGENDLTWDMGIFVTPASLGDYVWYDDNNDGKQDADEKPAVGIRVLLYGEACGVGNFLAETTTDANGKYLFDNLAPGKYTVTFINSDGTSFTQINNVQGDDAKDSDASTNGCSHVVTLDPGENDLTIDAGLVKLASLGDYVWIDKNRDGIQDAGEVGVEGVHVLLLDKDGKAIPGKELVTDKDGKYLFTGLLPGTYSVQFVVESLPVGYQVSPANKGSDDAKDSDGDIVTGKTATVILKAGEQNLTLDLGINIIPAKLGDKVFEDKDEDGIQDEGEPGIKGAKVELYACDASGDAKPLATTTTDDKGNYIFENLEPGSYVVKFYTPDGMVITSSLQGPDRALDSDAGKDGKTACVKLGPGETNLTVDAGVYKPKVPVQVLPNVITRPITLPFTGSESLQLVAFAASLVGIGLLTTGFFSRRKRVAKLSWY